jgi:exo-beta-1,3-glucanase (GH17 family)
VTVCTQTLVPELALLQHEVTELRERAALLSEQMHTAVLSAPCSSSSCTNSSSNSSSNSSTNYSNGSSSNGSSSSNGASSSGAVAGASSKVKGVPGLCQQCEHLRSDMSRFKAKLDEVRTWPDVDSQR